MTSDVLFGPTHASGGPHDVVGARVLVGVQMVDISRLSTHPVPLIAEGLITVAGQGPKDSNGAGKSSFIAAISLLNADQQWRLSSGASKAADLLFTAELAAQDQRWSNADHGYIIGVFASPAAVTVAELETSVLTVWLRINRKAPYIDLRWIDGLHVPIGTSEDERAGQADVIWQQLPRRNARTDFHAGRMAEVLYGRHVRCVSFLSTSVRESDTANLLARPLNELPPEQIFDAIATLTGLDRELAHEQELRTAEHSRRAAEFEAKAALDQWERDARVIETAIDDRARARALLSQARETWRGRCARHLIDALALDERLRTDLSDVDNRLAQMQDARESLTTRLRSLRDDEDCAKQLDQRKRERNLLRDQERQLEVDQSADTQRIADLTARLHDLQARAGHADGRTLDRARLEEQIAEDALQEAVGHKAVADAARTSAQASLTAAEGGHGISSDQTRRLQDGGITAAALLDVVQLSDPQRDVWEPRLAPYRDALVVRHDQLDAALTVLEGLPGSMLVAADLADPDRTTNDLPHSAIPQLSVSTFLSALAARSGSSTHEIDRVAGVVVVGGFSNPVTGRPARIAAARERLDLAADRCAAMEERKGRAQRLRDRARERTQGARAGVEATDITPEIAELRAANAQRENLRNRLHPDLEQAERAYQDAYAEQHNRDQEIQTLSLDLHRRTTDLEVVSAQRRQLASALQSLDLSACHEAWGETVDAAQRHLLGLDEAEQQRGITVWNEDACRRLDDVVRRCFPEGSPSEHLGEEIREILIAQRWNHGSVESRVPLAPSLLRAVHNHLAARERQDEHDKHEIEKQRETRTKGLAAAQEGMHEAALAADVQRASLASGIKNKLKKVAEEFDRLDQQYGGYGAGLDYPEPEPPSQPDKPWRWAVTPKWRRAEGQRMASYRLRANTAQIDEKAVKLVCAAGLAGTGDRPLLLVLDELGRNLGSEHRREAVALFERIGADRNITVIGALQDDMERYAINASGLYIKLRRSSDAMAYNEAPVVHGSEANRARVELLGAWLSSYRPEMSPDVR
jgi:chromosome segregation protein